MNKIFTLLLLCSLTGIARAQTTPTTQVYGKVEQADLDLKQCDFEKDANAEVLFETGKVYYGGDLNTITMEVHRRIKIFNDNGKDQADVHLPYISDQHYEYITGMQAETINFVDGKPVITKLEKKDIFTKSIDKESSEIAFTMPNVKPGCIIEYKYKWNTASFRNMPAWFFQNKIPTRYSEFTTSIPDVFYFRPQTHISRTFLKNTSSSEGRSFQDVWTDDEHKSHVDSYPYIDETAIRAMADVPSMPSEPFMSAFIDNAEGIRFQLISIKPLGGFAKTGNDTWAKVAGALIDDEDFGGQINRKLDNEEAIITKAKALKLEDRMAYIFNEVKNTMKWNEVDTWYTIDGTSKAWSNKTGNSAEINLILYHLLKKSGVDAYPMAVSTREHGKVLPYYTSAIQFNRAVVYVPIDSNKRYIMDATGKYNIYNQTPAQLLNSSGLWIDKSKKGYDMFFIKNDEPIRQVVLISGDIKANGKLEGTAQISNSSYNKINAIEKYKKEGEKKYIDYLRDNDNNLSVSSIKMENMDVDTLPLIQNLDFKLDLAGSDENYIYLNPNIFTSLKSNPFLSETRMTDIDFGYLRNYSINGVYKVPAGYKIDALPKSMTIIMPDKSVSFKRIVAEQDGSIVVRYSINYNKALYFKESYPDFHEFFKKMQEMLNEQIVLKKS
jgi:Domain of Unknown Function with PDB structure (DUF3857)